MKIIGGLSTLFVRQPNLYEVINSLTPQLDILLVYLDYDENENVELKNIPGNVVVLHKKYINNNNNNNFSGAKCKFLFIDECYELYNNNFIYFSFDDDIIYPHNYVANTIDKLNKYNKKAVVCYHGGILPTQVTCFSQERNLIHFAQETELDTLINICGTGVTAFYAETLKNISFDIFKYSNKVDLCFAVFCQNNKIPIICAQKEEKWLDSLPIYGIRLWDIEVQNTSETTRIANELISEWTVIKSL